MIDFVTTPGSFRPVGECDLSFEFDHPWPGDLGGDQLFLVIEGTLGRAEVRINDQPIGAAMPYVPYRFPVPATSLHAKKNVICVHMTDIIDGFGPMPGRRQDTGIHREVRLERRPAAWIENVGFRAELAPNWSTASCEIETTVRGASCERLNAVLIERATGRQVAAAQGEVGSPLRIDIPWPRLWSPERPDLYELVVHLVGQQTDTVREVVGFRKLETRGRDFYLNGKRLLIKGVCRHEFTSRHGYAPTNEEVAREMALIKHSGFNYVRLVHSPQAAIVPRIAAELGLLVSEEPGTCWHDLSLPDVAELACNALCRTVLRDRNLPNILAWYLYNECEPYAPYMVEAARRCREIDPVNFVSTVNATRNDQLIHEVTDAANLSFYGLNQYSFEPSAYVDRMASFTDRPLVFTEWGGWMHQRNPQCLEAVADAFAKHSRDDADPRMAGFSFWAWADYEEYSRPPQAALDGWTIEGLLDCNGKPRAELQTLSLACFAMDHPEPAFAPEVEVLAIAPARRESWSAVPLDTVGSEQRDAEEAIARLRAQFQFVNPSLGKLLVDGIPFQCREDGGQSPLLIGAGNDQIVIPVGRVVRAIAVLGHVALRGGFPYSTTGSVFHPCEEQETPLGSPASRYDFVFADAEETIDLRHGVHMVRGNDICRWWKTAPRSAETRPAVRTVLHPSYEILRYDLWEWSLPSPRRLEAIRWSLEDTDSIQALLALSVLTEEAAILANAAKT